MFIDTSVFVSLLIGEADSTGFADAIEVAPQRYTSGLVRLETVMVTATRLDTEPGIVSAAFDSLLADTLTTVVPITDAIARLATEAFARYGKGRGHPAQLNLADCLSYACARAYTVPLLYKGDDFGHTDITADFGGAI